MSMQQAVRNPGVVTQTEIEPAPLEDEETEIQSHDLVIQHHPDPVLTDTQHATQEILGFDEGLRRVMYSCFFNAEPYIHSNDTDERDDPERFKQAAFMQRLVRTCFNILGRESGMTDEDLNSFIVNDGGQAVRVSGKAYGSRQVALDSTATRALSPSATQYAQAKTILHQHIETYGDVLRSEEHHIRRPRFSLLDHVRDVLLGPLNGFPEDTIYQQLLLGPDVSIDPAAISEDEYMSQMEEFGTKKDLKVLFDSVMKEGKPVVNSTLINRNSLVLTPKDPFITKHEPELFKAFNVMKISLRTMKAGNNRLLMDVLGDHVVSQWNSACKLDWTKAQCQMYIPPLMDFVITCCSRIHTVKMIGKREVKEQSVTILPEHATSNATGSEIGIIGHTADEKGNTFTNGSVAFSCASGIVSEKIGALFEDDGTPTADLHGLYDTFVAKLKRASLEYGLPRDGNDNYMPGLITPEILGYALTCRFVTSCHLNYKRGGSSDRVTAHVKTLITVMRVGGVGSTIRLTKRPPWTSNPMLVSTHKSVIHGMQEGATSQRISNRVRISDSWSGLPTTGVTRDEQGKLNYINGPSSVVKTGINSLLTYSGWEVEDIIALQRGSTKVKLMDLCENAMLMAIAVLYDPNDPEAGCSFEDEEKDFKKLEDNRPEQWLPQMEAIKTSLTDMIDNSVVTGMLDVVYVGRRLLDENSLIDNVLTSRTVLLRLLFSIMSRVVIRLHDKPITTAIFPPRIMRARNIPLCLSKDGWRIYTATPPVLAGLFKEKLIKQAFIQALTNSGEGNPARFFNDPYSHNFGHIELHGIVRAPLIEVSALPTSETRYSVVIQHDRGKLYALDAIIAAMNRIVEPSTAGPVTAIIYDPRFAIALMHEKISDKKSEPVIALTLSTRTSRIIPKTANADQAFARRGAGGSLLKHSIYVDQGNHSSYLRSATEVPMDKNYSRSIMKSTEKRVRDQVNAMIHNAHEHAMYDTIVSCDESDTPATLLRKCKQRAIANLLSADAESTLFSPNYGRDNTEEDARRSLLSAELAKLTMDDK
jgi:hypothetical protein